MSILNFLAIYWDSILLVVLFIAGLAFLWFKGKKNIVYKILYALVTEAEKIYGDGTGSLKQATVISQIYDKLPAIFRSLISVTTLERWVDDVVERAKIEWGKNANIEEYITVGAKMPTEDVNDTAE